MLDAIQRERGLGRNRDRSGGLIGLPARREGFDEGDEIRAILVRQGDPRGHVGVYEASRHGVEEVFVGRQRSGGRRAALEGGRDEIARQDIQVWPVFSVAVAAEAVAAPAVAKVELSSSAHVSSIFADVGFSLLRRGQREDESCKNCDTEQS